MSTQPPTSRRFQFSLAWLLGMTAIAALGAFFCRFGLRIVLTALVGVIAANMLGAVAALFVTHVIGLPNDGSLRRSTEPTDEPK